MEKVHIFDTTLRDGEQVPGCKLNIPEKLEIALQLESLGVDVIEAGFPISSPGDFEAVQSISRNIKDAIVCGLSRSVQKDIDCAIQSLCKAKRPRLHTGIGVSDTHIKYKFKTSREDIIERTIAAVSYAKKHIEDIEFYAEDAGRADNEFLAKVIQSAINAGATVVNIPDTTGFCLPEEYRQKIAYLREHVDGIHNVIIATHCHNDLGLATANSIAGIEGGARQIECTINGTGERAGNTALEEVVMILKKRYPNKFQTNIQTSQLAAISDLVSNAMGVVVQPNKAIVGENAFGHSSGIHQDGVLKHRENYEIIDPKEVGYNQSKIILTARSGRAAVAYKAKTLGYELTKKSLDSIYSLFIDLADKQKEVKDQDLLTILKRTHQFSFSS